jgi:hypothetical protein
MTAPSSISNPCNRAPVFADRVYCANLYGGPYFAVADACRRRYDVPGEETLALLRQETP